MHLYLNFRVQIAMVTELRIASGTATGVRIFTFYAESFKRIGGIFDITTSNDIVAFDFKSSQPFAGMVCFLADEDFVCLICKLIVCALSLN